SKRASPALYSKSGSPDQLTVPPADSRARRRIAPLPIATRRTNVERSHSSASSQKPICSCFRTQPSSNRGRIQLRPTKHTPQPGLERVRAPAAQPFGLRERRVRERDTNTHQVGSTNQPIQRELKHSVRPPQ